MQSQLSEYTEKEYCLFSSSPSSQAVAMGVLADTWQAAVAFCSCGKWLKDVI